MSDSYGIVPVDPYSSVGSRAPGLPAVDLPTLPTDDGAPPRRPLRVDVAPSREELEAAQRDAAARQAQAQPPPGGPTTTGAAPRDLVPLQPWSEPAPSSSAAPSDLMPLEDWTPADAPPPIGRTETGLRAAAHGLTFGAEPWLEGAWEGGLPYLRDEAERTIGVEPAGMTSLVTGERYTEPEKRAMLARQEAQRRYEQAYAEHPEIAYPAEIAGSIAPMFIPGVGELAGAGRLSDAATLSTRILRGGFSGAGQGALYGVGSGLSEDRIQDAGDLVREGVRGGVGGAIVGSALHGAIGPRPPAANPGAGAAAARTAEQLGAPLPRGVVSDSRGVQNLTAALQSTPFIGHLIPSRVAETQRAAGNRILDIASQGTGVAPTRTGTGAMLRGAVASVIDRNNAATDAAYANLRGMIRPRHLSRANATERAVASLQRARRPVVSPNTGLNNITGLVGRPVNFEHLLRARHELGQSISSSFRNPNPGVTRGELRALYGTVTQDIENHLRGAVNRGVPPDDAVAAFRQANQTASRHISRNAVLNGLLRNQSDERLAGSLINSARDRTGNLRMLAQLRNELRPQEFEQLAGTMLGELGRNRAGDFSLRQFISDWQRVQGAGAVMFSPQHLQAINDIVGMGRHIGAALANTNYSHTGNTLLAFEMLSEAGEFALDAIHGGVGWGTVIGLGQAAGVGGLTWILASPARAQSAARWVNARRALDLGVTAARMAAFVTATRNLSHTLGVRVEDLAHIITQRDPLAASTTPDAPRLPAPATSRTIPGPTAVPRLPAPPMRPGSGSPAAGIGR